MEELYMLYNQDALDKSLISCWVLMEIQTCRRMRYHDVGFMDPEIILQANLRDKPNHTMKNIFKFLDKHWNKKYILLLWNFNYHWILLVIVPDWSFVYVFDSLRKPKEKYADIMNALNKC
nr:uncharacterized protein LOC117834164 [Setaria viridis]